MWYCYAFELFHLRTGDWDSISNFDDVGVVFFLLRWLRVVSKGALINMEVRFLQYLLAL